MCVKDTEELAKATDVRPLPSAWQTAAGKSRQRKPLPMLRHGTSMAPVAHPSIEHITTVASCTTETVQAKGKTPSACLLTMLNATLAPYQLRKPKAIAAVPHENLLELFSDVFTSSGVVSFRAVPLQVVSGAPRVMISMRLIQAAIMKSANGAARLAIQVWVPVESVGLGADWICLALGSGRGDNTMGSLATPLAATYRNVACLPPVVCITAVVAATAATQRHCDLGTALVATLAGKQAMPAGGMCQVQTTLQCTAVDAAS